MGACGVNQRTLDLRKDVINPLPSQALFLDAMYRYEYVLFGGAAGPGKSYILRWGMVEWLLNQTQRGFRHVVAGLFSEDYPSLKDRQISKIKREFPSWLGEVKDTPTHGLGFYFAEDYGGHVLSLRNLDDPAKYASAEFAAIAVDELTKNPRQTFDDLRFRKRWPGLEHSPFLAASNPGSLGHAWVKKLWLDKDFSGDDNTLNPDGFHFIPARAGENPHLPQSYLDTLHSLPPSMRRAMEEGDWDLFVGQFFSEWRRDLHTCAPFAIPRHWKRIISLDYGFQNPSAVLWFAVDPEGHWWLYRELYQRGLTYPVLAQEITERTPLDEDIYVVVADPAIWGDRPRETEQPGPSGGEQLADLFDRRGWSLVRGNHERLAGWQQCRKLLQTVPAPDGRVQSRFRAFTTCTNFLRTIPSLVHDEIKVEDLDTDGEDHAADAWRYACHTKAEYDKVEERDLAYESAIATLPVNGGYGFGR